ncbi:MAG TPA: DoxX family membrane protein [Pyrinomonadaceae bacterium]|nr:DoxX family membrane protein [Pyrinomonadaceae bacterium]
MKIIKGILKVIFASIFILAGVLHFVKTDFFMGIMPPVIPWHLFWVYLSGVFEIALGIMLLIPKFSRAAAYGLIVLLIMVFPANIYMAMNPQLFSEFSQTGLYLRLFIQFILIGWAYWFTYPKN